MPNALSQRAALPFPPRDAKRTDYWPTSWDRLTETGRARFLADYSAGEALVGWDGGHMEAIIGHGVFDTFGNSVEDLATATLFDYETTVAGTNDIIDEYTPFTLGTAMVLTTTRLTITDEPVPQLAPGMTQQQRAVAISEAQARCRRLALPLEVPVMLRVGAIRDLSAEGQWKDG